VKCRQAPRLRRADATSLDAPARPRLDRQFHAPPASRGPAPSAPTGSV
jgi:hypothetical protein